MKLKDWLSDFLDSRNKDFEKNPALEDEDRTSFLQAVDNCWIVFGTDAFRQGKKNQQSAPLADAVLYSLAKVDRELIKTETRQTLKDGFQLLCKEDTAFVKAITSGTNGIGAIRTRLSRAEELVKSIV
jgi:hypothetical protein